MPVRRGTGVATTAEFARRPQRRPKSPARPAPRQTPGSRSSRACRQCRPGSDEPGPENSAEAPRPALPARDRGLGAIVCALPKLHWPSPDSLLLDREWSCLRDSSSLPWKAAFVPSSRVYSPRWGTIYLCAIGVREMSDQRLLRSIARPILTMHWKEHSLNIDRPVWLLVQQAKHVNPPVSKSRAAGGPVHGFGRVTSVDRLGPATINRSHPTARLPLDRRSRRALVLDAFARQP